MKDGRHIIWSNDIDYDDWREDLEEQYPDLTEAERMELMYELNGDYLDDERSNLDIQLSRPILVVGDLGLWHGRRMGYKEIPSGNIRDCLYSERDIDYSTWYVDKNGDFRCDAIHHDGTNHYLYRAYKDGVSDTQIENLKEKLYRGTATRADITRSHPQTRRRDRPCLRLSHPPQTGTGAGEITEATMMNISDTRDCAFEAFITNLGKYNEGFLVGEWVKFPVTNEEMQAVFRRIGIGRRYEEWFITDYDCPDAAIGKVLGEYESLSELNYLAGQIMELRESDDFWQAVLDLGENTGSVQELINLTENLDCFDYLPGVRNDYDLGYYWIEESGCYDTSNLGALANYIDYEGFGRDIRYEEGGVFGDNGYVRSNGGRFVDIYDGDIENIPEEYRISSPAVPVRSAAPRQTEQPER